MKHDLYADLASLSACPTSGPLPSGLASGFVNGCTAWFAKGELETDKRVGTRMKNDARNCYMQRAQAAELLPQQAAHLLDAAPPVLQRGWLAINVSFTLQTPWYSKDDRPFHVLDNPVRKDCVFGVPYMSAASWKGMLRWAVGMTTGLIGPAPIKDEKARKAAEAKILHLFGNEKGATDDFQRGAVAFYPTWFPKIGFEVINPHNRETRAGTQPIYYEVVPAGTRGSLRLLYAPLPGQAARNSVDPQTALRLLVDATEELLTVYGFSAKRTGGWGVATIDKNGWEARGVGRLKCGSRDEVVNALGQLLGAAEAKP